MKTLAKIAKQRGTIPVINMINVKGGRAMATNLDTLITGKAPEGLADGLYHGQGFAEGMPVLSNIPASDFPDTPKIGEVTGKINLSRAWALDCLAFVAATMSDEATRYYLNGVCFDKNRIVSTDGHRLSMARITAPFPVQDGRGFIVPKEAIKFILELIKEEKAANLISLTFHDRGLAVEIGESALYTRIVEGTFPDYNMVIPKHTKSTVFNAAELLPIIKEAKILSKIDGNKIARLVFSDGKVKTDFVTDTPNKEWQVSTKTDCSIYFRGDYLKDVCNGVMYYDTPRDPIRIDSELGVKTSVLMPIR